MSTPSERPEPFAQSPLGSGIGIVIATGLWTGLLKWLDKVPVWVTVLVYVVLGVAFVLNLVPAVRRWLIALPKRLLAHRPVFRFRFDTVKEEKEAAELRARAAEEELGKLDHDSREQISELQHYATVRDAEHSEQIAEHVERIKELTDSLERARAEKRAAQGVWERQMDRFRRDHENETSALIAKNSEQVHETLELGKQLGREMERYGDDWEHMSPVQRAEAKQKAQRREAQHRALQKTIADLEARVAADQDERTAGMREQYDAGLKEGLRQAGLVVDKHLPPPPYPRWHIDSGTTPSDWALRNSVPGSVAARVRLETDASLFEIRDAAYWPEMNGPQAGEFRGRLTPAGRNQGATIRVEWHDEDGNFRSEEIYINPPPKRDAPRLIH